MPSRIHIALALLPLSLAAARVPAQTQTQTVEHPSTKSKAHHKPVEKKPSVETQLREMREELQLQIDQLKSQLAEKDAQIRAIQDSTQVTAAKADTANTKVDAVTATVQQNATTVTDVQSSETAIKAQVAADTTQVQQVQTAEIKLRKDVDEPVALHYKGITITPGGFIAGESIWRQRAMNADIYTNFNATPYPGAGEAHTSEWVPSARQTRLSALASGKVPFGTVSGYFEGDFLSAGTTSNNTQSNSYTLRVRQAWGQASFGTAKFTGGQMWTLLTENRTSTDAGKEALPLIFDGNLHVGASYVRQTAFRFQNAFSPKFTLAMSLENSQYVFSASNAPTNFFFGNIGAQAGLNNQTANYANQVAPDVIVKAAFDPGFGHYEIGGIARFFRDRYYPATTTAVGAQNDTKLGGGLVANARFPVAKKLDVGLHLVAGDGTGRYGPSLLPDITVHPDGTLALIHNAQGLFSLELHASKKLDIFGYAGTEYAQRTVYRNATTGVLVGYAPTTANNTGCFVEAPPTAGTGFAPGVGTCLGATRDITQGSAGWTYRIYSGPAGKLQYGAAYSYLNKRGWSGVGGAPKATNNFVYTSFRYYLP